MPEWRQTKVSSDFHEGFRIPGVSSKRTVCRIFWDSSMTESTEWNKDSTNVKLIVKTNDCWCVNFPWDCLTSREHVRLRSSSCSVNSPYRHEPHPFLYCRMSQSQRTHPPEIKTQYINGFVKLPRKLGMWISWISSSYKESYSFWELLSSLCPFFLFFTTFPIKHLKWEVEVSLGVWGVWFGSPSVTLANPHHNIQ